MGGQQQGKKVSGLAADHFTGRSHAGTKETSRAFMIKPRILIFSVAYEPLVGGAELAVRHITDRLSSFEFDLITCRFAPGHRRKERVGNVNVYRVGFGSRLGRYIYPALAYRLARKLHKVRPYQVVWSIMAAYAGAAALMFKRRQPEVKLLLTLQEGDPIEDHIHKKILLFVNLLLDIEILIIYLQVFQRFSYNLSRVNPYLRK